MIVHTLNLSRASWNSNRQFTTRVHLSVENLRQCLSACHSPLPCFDDARHIFGNPFGSQRAAVDKYHHRRNTRSRYGFHQFLLTSRQRKLVTVAVLSASLLVPVVTHGVFSYHKNCQVRVVCPLHCILNLAVGQ